MSKTIFETPEAFTFESLARPSRVAIRREGGAYLVMTYQGGACTKRDQVATHDQAWKLARSIRGGVSI